MVKCIIFNGGIKMRYCILVIIIVFNGCIMLEPIYKNKDRNVKRVELAFMEIRRDSLLLQYCQQKQLDCNSYFIQKNPIGVWLPPFIIDYASKHKIPEFKASFMLDDIMEKSERVYMGIYTDSKNRFYSRIRHKHNLGIFWFPIDETEMGIALVDADSSRPIGMGSLTYGNNVLYYWVRISKKQATILYTGYE
jgi:hypothetical protein